MPETGWINDIFHDVLDENDLFHLEVILPHLSEVIAKESERLANEEIQEQRVEFLKDLKRAYKKPSLGLCWSEVKKAIEKWEGKK